MELRDYLQVIRRRIWWIIITIILVTASAVLYSVFFQEKQYQAVASVLIKEQPAASSLLAQNYLEELSTQPERSVQTQVELLKSKALAERVGAALQLDTSPGRLMKKLTVEPLGKTNIIRIKIIDNIPETARDLANQYATQYQEWRLEENAKGLRDASTEVLSARQKAKDEAIEYTRQIEEKLNRETVPEELKLEQQNAFNNYLELESSYRQLTIAEELMGGQYEVLIDEDLPGSPIQPRPWRNGLLAFFTGTLLGLGLAFLVDYLDDTVGTREEAERLIDAPILGEIPRASDSSKDDKKSVITMVTAPKSSTAESFRALRTNIQYINYERDLKVLMFTSAGPEVGKSFMVANLGVALAEAGHRVIVICADMRKPNLHTFFHLDNKIGLSTVLIGKASLEESLRSSGMMNLKVLPSGPLPPNPSELLGSRRMNEVLENARQLADIVLVDTPPVLATSDSAVLGPRADGVIIVISAGSSKRDETRKTRELLEQVNSKIIGVILNNVSESHNYGYYYYYSYGERQKKK
jgi:succinoglycan biosynthesis transport protein ExoP